MYAQAQPPVSAPGQGQPHGKYSPVGDGEDDNAAVCGGGKGESIENAQIVEFDEGSTIGGLDGVEVVPHDSMYSGGAGAVCSEGMGLTQTGDVSNQLTLSLRGQVYVFDSVPTEKVQGVLLPLGGCEYTPGTPGGEGAYQNPRGFIEYTGCCSDPKRAESLNRFRQKRKERCFEKKIRYNVRQEVALREAPQLVALLREMKEGLDTVRTKIEALTANVMADHFPTKDGISYLEAKHLLLLNYCQSLVYYLLRKAKGLSIDGHPVVKSLVEIRLYLEKIRPIDKKLEYQIKKLTRAAGNAAEQPHLIEKENDIATKKEDELFKYHPNPDLLISKTDMTPEYGTGVYKPPKIAPTAMTSREERNALRKEQQILRQSRESAYVRELMNDLEGKPEEVSEVVGAESRELTKYMAKMEERARQEEELFTRAPLTKSEQKRMKHMKKSRNGLLGLSESFFDEIKGLPLVDGAPEQSTGFDNGRQGERRPKKQKRKH